MLLFAPLLALIAIAHAGIASAQDYSGIHEITSGPDGADVICLLLHGAAFSSADWAPGSITNTLTVLGDAGAQPPSNKLTMYFCVHTELGTQELGMYIGLEMDT